MPNSRVIIKKCYHFKKILGVCQIFSKKFDKIICMLASLPTKKEGAMITYREAEIRSEVIKAMAHPVRLIVIEVLKNGEKSFSELMKYFDIDKSTLSKHISVLKNSGIVISRREKSGMFYHLQVPCITEFFSCVTAVIKDKIKREQCCIR